MPSIAPDIRAAGLAARDMFDALKFGEDVADISLSSRYEHLRSELVRLADHVLRASQRHYMWDVDSEAYYDVTRTQNGAKATKEQDFREQFRPIDVAETIREGCALMDKKRRVQALYLPGVIEPKRQAMKEPIVPSKDLATLGRDPTRTQHLLQAWVVEMEDSAIILSCALAIVHPEQFELSLRCLEKLCEEDEFASIAEQWAFAFSAVSVISNRETPEHRDKSSGGYGMFDLLLSIGGCPRTALELPGLGVRFAYESGTIVLFSGHVHLHTVSPSEKERMCIACYARKAVHHKFGLNLPSSVTIQELLSDDFTYVP
ncbi:unnamed protein product [Peniophora sp. CBMAI 1063]|nr:unnamed protein product [Peniophora sp. CBMAI 1063]